MSCTPSEKACNTHEGLNRGTLGAALNPPVNKRDLSTGENGETGGGSGPVGRGNGGSRWHPSVLCSNWRAAAAA